MGAAASRDEDMTPAVEVPPAYDDGQKIKSVSSVSRVTCNFHNHTPYTLNMMWLNYLGEATSYGVLKAGQTKLMYTYSTHPWIFRAMDEPEATPFLCLRGSRTQVLFPSLKQNDYHIEMAPSLSWSTKLHAKHWKNFQGFKAQVQTLLLCQHRLQQLACGTSSRRTSHAGSSFLACLPLDPRSPTRHMSDTSSIDGSETARSRNPAGGQLTSLQDIPHDLVLFVIENFAPRVPDVCPVYPTDMEMPPEELLAQHLEAAAAIQQQLAGNMAGAAPPAGQADPLDPPAVQMQAAQVVQPMP